MVYATDRSKTVVLVFLFLFCGFVVFRCNCFLFVCLFFCCVFVFVFCLFVVVFFFVQLCGLYYKDFHVVSYLTPCFHVLFSPV